MEKSPHAPFYSWHSLSLVERIQRLRFLLPLILVAIVITYQLVIVRWIEFKLGLEIHFIFEVVFYSITGPLATWATLVWVERELREKEALRQELQSVLEEERARIARDLHDSVAQNLYFLSLKSDMLHQANEISPQNRAEIKSMGTALRNAIREIRRTIFALRPLSWSHEEFLLALHHFVEGFAEQADLLYQITIDQDLSVPPKLQPAIFRLIQESLNNIAKHAQAAQVEVAVRRLPHAIQVEVQDNGQGFDIQNLQSHGVGLAQMADRVASLDGKFNIDSQPGHGCRICATFRT